jgi:hypothetical protein
MTVLLSLIAGAVLMALAAWFLSPPGMDKGPHW